jgi:hypothetical protein
MDSQSILKAQERAEMAEMARRLRRLKHKMLLQQVHHKPSSVDSFRDRVLTLAMEEASNSSSLSSSSWSSIESEDALAVIME